MHELPIEPRGLWGSDLWDESTGFLEWSLRPLLLLVISPRLDCSTQGPCRLIEVTFDVNDLARQNTSNLILVQLKILHFGCGEPDRVKAGSPSQHSSYAHGFVR